MCFVSQDLSPDWRQLLAFENLYFLPTFFWEALALILGLIHLQGVEEKSLPPLEEEGFRPSSGFFGGGITMTDLPQRWESLVLPHRALDQLCALLLLLGLRVIRICSLMPMG
jgi:hypothetical protein